MFAPQWFDVKHGHVVDAELPKGWLERLQMLEYVRSFVGARPGCLSINHLSFYPRLWVFLRKAVIDAEFDPKSFR